jgi:hypothetical protein
MGQTSRTRLVTALVLVAVFSSGLLLGLAADSGLVATPADEAVAVVVDEPDEERRVPMYEQVGPNPEQSVLIDSIVVEHRARMDSLHEVFRETYDPQYEAIVEQTREAIKQVFTPEQAATYDSLTEERDRRRAERGDGGWRR